MDRWYVPASVWVVPATLMVPTGLPSLRSDCNRVSCRVRKASIGRGRTGVGRDYHRRIGLGDAVIDCTVLVVVIGRACKAPWSLLYMPARCASCRLRRQSQLCPRLPIHASDRVGRRVRNPSIRRRWTGVRCDDYRGSCLGDAVVDRAVLVVVVGGASKAPRIIVVCIAFVCEVPFSLTLSTVAHFLRSHRDCVGRRVRNPVYVVVGQV